MSGGRKCGNCLYLRSDPMLPPCVGCLGGTDDRPNWKPGKGENEAPPSTQHPGECGVKNCDNCQHRDLLPAEEPCCSCVLRAGEPPNWEQAPSPAPSTQQDAACTCVACLQRGLITELSDALLASRNHSGLLLDEIKRLRHDLNQLREAMVRELAHAKRRA